MKLYKKILFVLLAIILDLAIYVFLGLMMMNYEDNYDSSLDDYYCLSSMTFIEKTTWISYVSWFILNGLGISYLIYKAIKKYKTSANNGYT